MRDSRSQSTVAKSAAVHKKWPVTVFLKMSQVLGSVHLGFGFLINIVIFVIPILIFILADCELISCDITESLIPDFTVWLF